MFDHVRKGLGISVPDLESLQAFRKEYIVGDSLQSSSNVKNLNINLNIICV